MSKLQFNKHDFKSLPRRFRARLINSLSGFKSANLVGTTDRNKNLNLSMVSSVVHLGANPPLIGMVMRPRTTEKGEPVQRDTVENIEATGYYTINHVGASMLHAAHLTSASFSPEVCEFQACGLTPHWHDGFAAPAVAESPLQMGLRLVEIVPFKVNGTEFVIGEIEWVRFAEQALRGDGYVAIEDLSTLAISGLDGYHSTALINRLEYAEPEKPVGVIPAEGAQDIEPPVDFSTFRESAAAKSEKK
ncbi:flavin oxidoreductase [Aliidiomarina iranensis]|uniref:Flavin oxidoreductase n=1 Tax=Aliidiomarina iranensis TaxID=1434071 RepID=A0A432VT44_9GAMM|nr:flavin reductase [Aliidiomarina iranensis]RUO19599.1 flavin oxidoreductase [Aliidiomarina iranensis]